MARRQTQELVDEIRSLLLNHLTNIGIGQNEEGNSDEELTKAQIRKIHAYQRKEAARREAKLFLRWGRTLLDNFAEGIEVDVHQVDPQLVLVRPETNESRLFRIATLLWSIPVSRGFGRRMRFLVVDKSNNKLIGLLAIGSPVFNLKPRDDWIGWNSKMREKRLVNVMDAFVVGAVPPYSRLIGGKMVASFLASAELNRLFQEKYRAVKGIISGRTSNGKLVLITVTSALGRSSIYNRLKIPGLLELQRLGFTNGWGHFHISENVFMKMKELLELEGHKYANGFKYGDGPNWRFRVVRQALSRVGLNEELMRHGIGREVYGLPLADKWRDYLLCRTQEVSIELPTVKQITGACLERWIVPRSKRFPNFREWTREDTWNLLKLNF